MTTSGVKHDDYCHPLRDQISTVRPLKASVGASGRFALSTREGGRQSRLMECQGRWRCEQVFDAKEKPLRIIEIEGHDFN